MIADATVIAERRGRETRCTTIRSSPPLTMRTTPPAPVPGEAPHPDGGNGSDTGPVVHLVGSAAGPVGGDRLRLTLVAGPGAVLTVRSVAATVVLPGPSPGAVSSLDVDGEAGPGARLAWLPEPTIAVRGCDHRSTTRLRIGQGAVVVWREVIVLGRGSEPPGSALMRLRVDRDGRPLLRTDVAIGPRWPASLGPAGVGTARAVGTALVVGLPAIEVRPDPGSERHVRAGVAHLGPDAALVTVVGEGARPVIAALDSLVVASTRDAG